MLSQLFKKIISKVEITKKLIWGTIQYSKLEYTMSLRLLVYSSIGSRYLLSHKRGRTKDS